MKKRIRYEDEPMGKLERVKDFLPPPERLVMRHDNIKVTISLSKASVDFFKRYGRKKNIAYQRLIRKLLDLYAERFRDESLPPRAAGGRRS